MKKQFLSVLGLAVLAVIFTSCKKQSVLDLSTISEKSVVAGYAEIVGDMEWDSDASMAVVKKPVPAAGKTIILEISNSKFMDGAKGSQFYETTVGSDGYFRFEANINPSEPTIEVSVYSKPFEGEITYFEDKSDKNTSEKVKVIFKSSLISVDMGKNIDASTGTLTIFPELLKD